MAEQEQGVDLTDAALAAQRWELYHVAEDFSECEDLAEQHPDKLRALIDRWWAEAGRYNVLPLDARFQARFSEPKPPLAGAPSPGEASRYVYYPDAAPVLEYQAVKVLNRSHTITAEVAIPTGGAEGVLLAQGGRFAGYSLYVQDRRLHYVHNYLGLQEHRISSAEELPTGRLTLRFVFTKSGEHQGNGALFVDDRQVGEGEILRTVPHLFDHTAEGLCCGYDSGLPVTDEYRSPFRFTGTIARVVVDVSGTPYVDPEAEARAAIVAE